jgi:hypothetical protein
MSEREPSCRDIERFRIYFDRPSEELMILAVEMLLFGPIVNFE